MKLTPASRADAQRLTPLPTRRPADYQHPVRRVPWDADGAGAARTQPSAGTDAGDPVENSVEDPAKQ